MHKMCTECGKHFTGRNKDMIIECKALGHRCIEVADKWDYVETFDPVNLKMNDYNEDCLLYTSDAADE